MAASSVNTIPVRIGDIATPAGYFGSVVQDALSAIAKKYYDFYSQKCNTTLEESMGVLGLPIGAVHATATPMVAESPKKAPVTRKRAPKTPSPHMDLVAKDNAPVPGWCREVHTKGKRKEKYCIRPVDVDLAKGNTDRCKICFKRILAAQEKKNAAAKAVGGIAPGAQDLTPGSFSVSLPVKAPQPRFTLQPYKGSNEFFIQEDTGIIYTNRAGTHIACTVARADGTTAPLGEAEIAKVKELGVPRLGLDGSIIWPDGRVSNPDAPAIPAPTTLVPPPISAVIPGYAAPPIIGNGIVIKKTAAPVEDDDEDDYYDDDDEDDYE